MRLLHTSTLTLKFFPGENKPQYAILSHTWGDEEVLFQDIGPDGLASPHERSPEAQPKKGLAKVLGSAWLAKSNGYDWIWIDTCCIDKSSSAELSEAINSMFRWYAESAVCYAYLSDVHESGTHRLGYSRWFSRGWTLQELIAPPNVEFYNASWSFVGHRNSLALKIGEISGIDQSILRHGHHRRCAFVEFVRVSSPAKPISTPCDCEHDRSPSEYGYYSLTALLSRFSVATRMFWASQRETTRKEDLSYCLLGLFNVNMPLIYGEGERAFSRLLKEIAQTSNDQSMLAWNDPSDVYDGRFSYPAGPEFYPFSFIHHNVRPGASTSTLLVTPRGLEATLLLCPWKDTTTNPKETADKLTRYIGILDCTINGDVLTRPALILDRVGDDEDMEFQRAEGRPIHVVQAGKTAHTSNDWGTADGKISTKNVFEAELNFAEAKKKTILVHGFFGSQGWATDQPAREVRITLDSDLSYRVTHCVPDFRSDPETGNSIVTLMPLSGHDNFVFVESPFAPPFVVMWTLTWCKVNDIDNVRAGVLSLEIPDSEQWPPEEVWEKAKYIAQSGAIGSPFSNCLCWDRLRRTKVSQHTLKRDGFEMTADLVEKSFLSQSTIELQISITKPGSASIGPQQ